MLCQKCQNDDERYFFKHKGQNICRKCIVFQRGIKESQSVSFNETLDYEYKLQFNLSSEQNKLSRQLVDLIKLNKDVLIYAACGCGKTEIVLELIKYCLGNNLIIGICIPRRQVVLELAARLSKYFEGIKVVKVCEGYTEELYGDLIICTTHQLYNYENYFDILIIDEPDAFPFANNSLLENFLHMAYKRNVVYLTATPTEKMKELETLTLFRRYHNFDLLVPKVVINFDFILYKKMIEFIHEHDKVMLFVPTIKLAKIMSKLLRFPCVHSQTVNKDEVIKEFNDQLFKVLITTTIMERGITIEGVNICVLFADHQVFTKASLIQIAGRVGRLISAPEGNGVFLCRKKSKEVEEAILELQMMNA